ncbi:hypothetical protein FVEN_g6777 [Fusarium venenatum]|uniref:Uncharacterized protein n=1 Tax=Fusarium venenatum TaxID=56646 RepID=A0A2L2TDZ6_9HYPO|nr:uncharacterized protein FVRRES_00163 [Fusarium venenatum]KAG8355341.1 hypothetical protein FVEN_g6777 [Fusarium venenatum]CEI63651.1 unnamed protein product [Fusarium venenatum]
MTVNLVIPGSRRIPSYFYVFIILTLLLVALVSSDWQPARLVSSDADRKFAFIIPATSSSPDLCKSIITALGLGYPSPIILNWGLNHPSTSKWSGDPNLAKIPGIIKYLDTVMHPDAHASERLRETDILLIADGYDVWFQLPAQILLERYHKINREANERLYQQWNKRGPMPMRQTTLLSIGKRCFPQSLESGSDLQCDEWPVSPLESDLYGPDTEEDETYYPKVRPQWINDGVIIGPAGDIRRFLRQVQAKQERGVGLGYNMYSFQDAIGQAMVEQEVMRQWQRENKAPKRNVMDVINSNLEFHAGLDYGQEISAQTMWTQELDGTDHGDFVRLGDQSDIDQRSEALGVIPACIRGVPEDIKVAKNPLSDMVGGANWTNMPLYADFYTNSVPAILHHNGMSDKRSTWWTKPWYHQHLRMLVKSRMGRGHPDEPLATVKLRNGRIRYWPLSAEEQDRYPRHFNGTANGRLKKMEFGTICRHEKKAPLGPNQQWWEEVFRDTGGPWGQVG